jgi:hypothetical protein
MAACNPLCQRTERIKRCKGVALLPPLKELNMFKHTLIAAVFVASSSMSLAQTAVAPAKPSTPAPAAAKTAAADPAVKKSNNDICHDKTSSGFASTKNFKPFATMDECIKSGGRAPKGPAKAAK